MSLSDLVQTDSVITTGGGIILSVLGVGGYYFRKKIDRLFEIADQANGRAATAVQQTEPVSNGFAATMLAHVERDERRWERLDDRLASIEDRLP